MAIPFLPTAYSLQPTAFARGRGRRGVLLLVVLSMLVLFALIGMTFVLVSSQYRRSSTAAGRAEQYGDDYRRQIDEVFAQVVRDTNNPHSALQRHSLLNDIYGPPPIGGSISVAATNAAGTNGQFIDITVAAAANSFSALSVKATTSGRIQTMSDTPGYYNGCVFTVIFGDTTIPNISTRIVGYTPGVAGGNGAITSGMFRVMALDGTSATPGATDRFLVNGRPFSGAGFGYNGGEPFTDSNLNGKYDLGEPFINVNGTPISNRPRVAGTGLLDLNDPNNGRPLALLPRFDLSRYLLGPDNTPNTVDDGIITPNEEYDAPDPQNMMLGFVQISPSISIIPSLHRPELINYWQTTAGANWDVILARQIMFRPLGPFNVNGAPALGVYPHPNFTGSNPTFDAVLGPWDVDNDGDGIAESIWVDVGMPVQTAPDGRRFKPLAAILCLDMDGRLNVNAHGSLAKFQTVTASGPFAGSATNQDLSSTLSSGEGYGPADVDLSVLYTGDATAAADYAALMQGNSTSGIVGRYGAGLGTALPGVNTTDDPFSYVKQFEFPRTTTTIRTSYMTPPDLWGRSRVGLDYRGQPLRYGIGAASYPNDSTDDPYELDLSRKAVRSAGSIGGVDNPFTVGELERVLRAFDVDASALPDRLRALLAPSPVNVRGLVTTDSYDLPVPSFRPTMDMILGPNGNDGIIVKLGVSGTTNLSFVDLLKYRLVQNGVANTTAALNAILTQLWNPELVAGLRMDINRPFGNGRDDNVNNIVDEPAESAVGSSESLWTDGNSPTGFSGVLFRHNNWEADINNDGTINANDAPFDRQLYARQLYVLMMLLKDKNFFVNTNVGTQAADTARVIAQWAVNVVDFRDADSIMTPFKYPIDPFTTNGWSVNTDITTVNPATEGLVWGCERPELLITETLAFHDRRTEDLANETPSKPTDMAGTFSGGVDADFDQRLRPRGSLFIELYNPWTTQASTASATGNPSAGEAPAEFYSINAMTNVATGVNLNQVAPSSSPVWRLLIVKGTALAASGQPKDPDDPVAANRPQTSGGISNPPATDEIQGSVYFVNPGSAITGHGQPYFTTLPVAPLLPGRYAVVGSAGQAGLNNTASNKYVNTIGRLQTTSALGTSQDGVVTNIRQILLIPNVDPNSTTNQVQLLNNGKTPAEPTYPDIQYSIAVVMNQTLDAGGVAQAGSLNVSEPVYPGYTAGSGWNQAAAAGEGTYSPPIDIPLDASSPDSAKLTSNATYPNYRVIHLQRLADPTLAYNAATNPYLTIDSMPVALTTFNGATNDPEPVAASTTGISSFQRGDNDIAGMNNLWHRENPTPAPTTVVAAANPHNFNFVLQHSLGYLNTNYGDASLGSAFKRPPDAPVADYAGAPKNMPFTWLTWNNRPYISPVELMLVPKSRSSQLTFDFTRASGTDPYTNMVEPYGHLLDFFQSTTTQGQSAQLHRLFDYVQVPSRFVDTETVLNPSTTFFGIATNGTATAGFHPPFNKVSNYRDPGRVNINTISDPQIWTGLMSNGLLSGPAYATLDLSRKPGTISGPVAFSNPFRSAGGVASVLPPYSPTTFREADLTFLRASTPTTGAVPLFSSTAATLYNEPNRNAYFRYQVMQKLSNSLTTRSNVYAIWITVGYFEVDFPGVSTIFPDGYRLGQEVGSDSGEIKRHRAFYIYDRSIPVGFEPGKDHNFDRGILLKRFIE